MIEVIIARTPFRILSLPGIMNNAKPTSIGIIMMYKSSSMVISY
jgi:hypothetical protein